jgi:hypothetical protein
VSSEHDSRAAHDLRLQLLIRDAEQRAGLLHPEGVDPVSSQAEAIVWLRLLLLSHIRTAYARFDEGHYSEAIAWASDEARLADVLAVVESIELPLP